MDGSMDGNTHHNATVAALEITQNFAYFWLLYGVVWGCDDGVGVALMPWQCIQTWAQTPMMDMEAARHNGWVHGWQHTP